MTPDTGSPVSLWLREVRLPFLTASVIPVLVGAAVAWHDARLFNLPLFLLTLAGAVLAHAGANMANDYFDAKSGNDALNRYRSPFNGGAGVIQAGLLTPRQVHLGSLVCLAAAAGIGLYLSAVRGPGVLALMLTGGVAAYFYTANPIRFAYHGVGELLVGLSFGPLIVVGAHLVQTGAVSPAAVMASLPVGFLIMAVLYINQFPDFEADRAVGKRHWVVRLGTRRALPGLAVLLLAPYPAVALAVAVGLAPWTALACLLTVPLALRAFRVALLHHDAPVALRPANAMVIGTHLLTGLLLTGGYLAGALLGRGS